MKSLAVVLNARAGRVRALSADALLDRVKAAADWADISVFDAGEDIASAARAACASGADAVAIAGGDGTATSVLSAAREAGCGSLMVPLPLGTANMLPRRLYGDRGFDAVLAELPGYEPVSLHAGRAADHLFFVALMAGAPVRFGQAREAIRPGGSGRRLGEAMRRLRQGVSSMAGSRLKLTLEGAEQKVSRSGAVMAAPGGFSALRSEEAPPGRDMISYLVVRPSDPADLALKTASFITGLPDPGGAAIVSEQTAVLSGPKHIHLMLDGEVFKATSPVTISLIKNAAMFAAPVGEGGP